MGANFSLVVAGVSVYTSPLLTLFPYSKTGDFSPQQPVATKGLSIKVAPGTDKLEFDFQANDRNLQLLLPITMTLTCSGGPCFSRPLPPPPGPPVAPGAAVCNTAGVCVRYSDGTNVADAVAIAAAADTVLIFTGTSSKEGADRSNLNLGKDDTLIGSVAAGSTGNKTAVIVVTPGAILTDWREQVGAVVAAFLPGQEYGHAIASILWGDFLPAGRLPITFPAVENEERMTPQQWPGVHSSKRVVPANATECLTWHDAGGCTAEYTEKLEVGYRWYAANPTVRPAFPFGHGLAFTTFDYTDLKVRKTPSWPRS